MLQCSAGSCGPCKLIQVCCLRFDVSDDPCLGSVVGARMMEVEDFSDLWTVRQDSEPRLRAGTFEFMAHVIDEITKCVDSLVECDSSDTSRAVYYYGEISRISVATGWRRGRRWTAASSSSTKRPTTSSRTTLSSYRRSWAKIVSKCLYKCWHLLLSSGRACKCPKYIRLCTTAWRVLSQTYIGLLSPKSLLLGSYTWPTTLTRLSYGWSEVAFEPMYRMNWTRTMESSPSTSTPPMWQLDSSASNFGRGQGVLTGFWNRGTPMSLQQRRGAGRGSSRKRKDWSSIDPFHNVQKRHLSFARLLHTGLTMTAELQWNLYRGVAPGTSITPRWDHIARVTPPTLRRLPKDYNVGVDAIVVPFRRWAYQNPSV